MSNKLVLAKYLRLSLEDDNDGESNSISNQRNLIDDHIRKHEDLIIYDIIEFKDDGFSGTNFNRPGFKALMEQIRKNKVNCVVVKDFSRFSRDYIELGNYLEQVFPFLEVRFISINDNYDSKILDAVHAGLDVPFRGILYDLYSKDISNKVKASIRQSMRKGELSGGSHPYGYVKSTEKGQTYEIDEEAAEVVRNIFSLAESGKSNIEIAKHLNVLLVPTPAMYKRTKGFCGYGLRNGLKSIWDSTKVHLILRDERYTGVLLLGQHKSAGIGTGKVIPVPREEWYRKDNSHPHIITKEQFEAVQQQKAVYVKRGKRNANHMLYRKVKCANCGMYLYHKPSEVGKEYDRFFCKKTHLVSDSGCFTGYIKEKQILEVLLQTINIHANIAAQAYNKTRSMKKNSNQLKKSFINNVERIEAEIDKLLQKKGEIYKQFKLANLTKEHFLLQKQQLSEEIIKLEAMKSQTNKITMTDELLENDFINSFKEYVDLKELSKDIIESLVDAIYVYDTNRIRIELLYKNEYEKAIKLL